MEQENKSDKLTETRGSFEKVSYWQRLYEAICPCITFSRPNKPEGLSISQDTKSNIKDGKNITVFFDGIDMKKGSIDTDSSVIRNKPRRSSLYVSDLNRKRTLNLQPINDYMIKSTIQKWHSYPIYQYYKEKQIFAIGSKNRKLLAIISSVRPVPSKASQNKTKRSASYMNDFIQAQNAVSNVDRFWPRRYYLFEKFDQGISMDDQSWGNVVPQTVAQYIASRIRCDTVLDAFCGVGGISLKLANTCYRVVANDNNCHRIKCLKRNANVYSVDNIEIRNNDFFQYENLEPDIIILHPSINIPKWQEKNSVNPQDLNPDFQKTISKAIQMSNNFVILLPANIDPNLLASCIAQQYQKSQILASTCSIKIQKIFFMSKMEYLAVFMGAQVQNQLKINDQLTYVYSLLKEKDGKKFDDKKIVKQIRQKYGMIKLLNFVLQSQQLEEGSPKDKFYEYIKIKGLLDEKKIQKIINQQRKKSQSKNSVPIDSSDGQQQQEKYVNDESIERTVSYYSTNSPNRQSSTSANFISGVSNRISADRRSNYSSSISANIFNGTNRSSNVQGLQIQQTNSECQQKDETKQKDQNPHKQQLLEARNTSKSAKQSYIPQ